MRRGALEPNCRRSIVRRAGWTAALVVLAAMAWGAGAAGVGAAPRPGVPETLRVGTDATYPPMEFMEGDEFRGFDMDLIREIGKRLGAKVVIQNVGWDGLIPGLNNRNYDVVISAMTILPERQQAVDFSDPYFNAGQIIVVRKGDTRVKGPNDLKGKVVAVQINTTGQFASEKIAGVTRIDKYDTTPLAVQAVMQRSADAAVIDLPVAVELVKEYPGQIEFVGTPFTEEYYGIAVRKGRPELLKAINEALQEIKRDGTYDKIYARWIGR
ncbi:MAG: basic amino acid ABC transporter substrate-binding protein [Limnochordaceae bacterium]|nr:basic amino acid ABC transporter substrate-binding protein [Limnochordaceae bacterium]